MTQKRTRAAYAIYLIAITVFFLYTGFPEDKILQFVNRAGANPQQPVAVSVQQVSPAIPPGIVFKGVRLSRNDTTLLQVARLTLSPDYLAMVTGKPALRFHGDIHGGSASGTIQGIGKDRQEIRLRFAAVDLSRLAINKATAPERSVTGQMSGQCRISTQPDAAVRIALETVITDTTVGLLMPIGNIRSIPFDRIEITASVVGRTVTISSCVWKGAVMAGSLTGTIGMQESTGANTISLKGNVIPQPALIQELGEPMASRLFPDHRRRKNGFQITFTGTVDKPVFDIK
ncbi:MAG: type II secretion system protein GspN [Pseudomonadota bacterium]